MGRPFVPSSTQSPSMQYKKVEPLKRLVVALLATQPAFRNIGIRQHIKQSSEGEVLLMSGGTPLERTLSLQHHDEIAEVRQWLQDYIIHHGLCPWAGRSDANGAVRIIASQAEDEQEAIDHLIQEAQRLLEPPANTPPLATTLLVCGKVRAWADDFDCFNAAVSKLEFEPKLEGIDLVAFHPRFARWRIEPYDSHDALKAGDSIFAHYEEWDPCQDAYVKSKKPALANVLSANEAELGVRNVHVVFKDLPSDALLREKENEYMLMQDVVPLDWLSRCLDKEGPQSPLLADNLIHRSPVPIIHLLHGEELMAEAELAGGDEYIKALQTRNARLARTRRLCPEAADGDHR